jgi:hypothetical protein
MKDLLRSLRTGMTAGRIAFEPLQRDFPGPVRGVIRGIDLVYAELDSATSRLAHSLFDEPDAQAMPPGWTLATLAAHPRGEAIFAQMAHGALAAAFNRFSDAPVLVSETLAYRAFGKALAASAPDRENLPAQLVLHLLAQPVIRAMPFDPHPDAHAQAAKLAVLAFVLMLCTAHDASGEDADLLDLCCDVAPMVLQKSQPLAVDLPALRTALSACARLI